MFEAKKGQQAKGTQNREAQPGPTQAPGQTVKMVPLGTPSSAGPLRVATKDQTLALWRLVGAAQITPERTTVDAIERIWRGWVKAGTVTQEARAYHKMVGRPLHDDLQSVFGGRVELRAEVSRVLGQPQTEFTWQAFLEQLAVGAAYAQKDDLSDAKGEGPHTNMGQVVKDAGFTPLPLVRGRWGLQLRVFKPTPGAVRPQCTPIR